MSASTSQTMTEAQGLEARPTLSESPDARLSHLHFDRRRRVWRGHPDVVAVATSGPSDFGTPELRSA
jgi:hypothetical protein